MSVDAASRFFAILAVLCAAATIGAIIVLVGRRMRPDSALARRADDLGGVALWLAWLVAAVTTGGSLYYSEVAHFLPCELCWYQRICMYPLSAILLIAAIKRDRRIWCYVTPLVTAGIVIASYHSQLQAYPTQQSFCSAVIPCTTRYVWEFGFVSLPLMDLVALCFVAVMLVAANSAPSSDPLPGGA